MPISPSIRALYRVIGNIIGKQIFNRISNDDNLATDPELRKQLARKLIDTITQLRRELSSTRNFDSIEKALLEIHPGDNAESQLIATKLLSWILEAYLLLNQSSTACAEITKPEALAPDRLMASKMLNQLRQAFSSDEELRKVFTENFSANLVLTAHPTAGIQPDYVNHIKHMVETVQEIAYRVNPEEWESFNQDGLEESFELSVADLIEDISLSISHMVRAKPYNTEVLRPVDESSNFLNNIAEAWTIIPAKIQALEKELKKYLGKQFRLDENVFKLHSWVARDIDGNPTVSAEQHLRSVLQERLHFLTKYRLELDQLWQNLSDDFTSDTHLPTKTFFRDDKFKALYDSLMKEFGDVISKPHQAYRVVIEYGIILKLEGITDKLLRLENLSESGSKVFQGFNVIKDVIEPLELIRANKVPDRDFKQINGTIANTKEIDLLIRKAQVFSDYGSHGHTRQGNKILAKLTKYLTALWDKQVTNKTNYVISAYKPDLIVKNDYNTLHAKILIQYLGDSRKVQENLLQTFDLLMLSELGAIKRQIISMNESFEDMLNVLVLAKTIGAFQTSTDEALPQSRLEIVPLTEQISDLRNSYRITINALINPAWHEYLIAQQGRFIKMRGPSDSGKQNGFVASQWEMFRSKQLDTLVVKIFNAYLQEKLCSDSKELTAWRKLAQGLDSSNIEEGLNKQLSESDVIVLALRDFDRFFSTAIEEDTSKQLLQGRNFFNQELWLRAYKSTGLKAVKLINFDGWGEPVERGGGLEFQDTVKCTQPLGSIPYYERTLQGGGAQQLASNPRTRHAIQDFINGITEIGLRNAKFELEQAQTKDLAQFYKSIYTLDPDFTLVMNKLVNIVRTALRSEVLGLDLDDDYKPSDETTLRLYFRHVIKSPLIFLDLFNIASRPTSRSGAQIKEFLDNPDYSNDLAKLAAGLDIENIVKILGDIRAIPYAAMFSLVGGNHVSFYGFDKVLANKDRFGISSQRTLVEWIAHYCNLTEDSQEARLMRHIINSLERGIMTADQDCYRKAHTIIEEATGDNYDPDKDPLTNKLIAAQQHTINFIAAVKRYQVADPKTVKIEELLQNDKDARDLLIARRNDAAVPRIGIAIAMSKILANAKAQGLNPLDSKNIPANQLDLLRKAFAAGASTFGNGCID